MSMQCIDFSEAVKIENISVEKKDNFNIFAQNIDCVYTLEPPLLDSTHNLCLEQKFPLLAFACHRLYI